MLKFPLFINCIMSEKIATIKKEDDISIITLDGKAMFSLKCQTN